MSKSHGIYPQESGRKPEGIAYFGIFPFHIYCSARAGLPFRAVVDGRALRVYWPFTNGPLEAERVNWSAVPYMPGSRPLSAAIPSVGITSRYNWPEPATAANALRVDFFPTAWNQAAIAPVVRLLGLLRWFTGQWWITRDMRFSTYPGSTALSVDAKGNPMGSVWGTTSLRGLHQIERLLTPEDFLAVGEAFNRGEAIPYSFDVFCDSLYFHAVGDERRFIMDASIACEAAIWELAQKRAADKGISEDHIPRYLERLLKKSNLIFNLDEGLRAVAGASFKDYSEDGFDLISRMWAARGLVAHGQPLRSRKETVGWFTEEDTANISEAVRNLFVWLQDELGWCG